MQKPCGGGAGVYLDGSSNMLVERNIVHHNACGITIGCEQANNTVGNNIVRDNIAYGNDGYGIGVAGWSPQNRIIRNCSITNNTTYGNAQLAAKRAQGELAIYNSQNLVVKNNIFYTTNTGANVIYIDDTPVNLQMSYNAYYAASASTNFIYQGTTYNNLYAYRSGSGMDNNSSFTDPMFVNAGAPDFHLQGGSVCIDACDPGYNPAPGETDMDGSNRKQGVAVDDGVYEYAGGRPGGGGGSGNGQNRFFNTGIMVNTGTAIYAGISAETFTNNGTYDATTGNDIFTGPAGMSGVQEITGSAAPAFGQLQLNNGAAFSISNTSGIDVGQQLTLNNGITTTVMSRHKYGAIRLGSNAILNATPGNSLHVNGYVSKKGSSAFTFPLGNGSALRTVQISAPSAATTEIAVAWLEGNPASTIDPSDSSTHPVQGAALGGNIVALYTGGSWDWISNRANTNALTITVSLPDLSTFASATALRLAGWNGKQWIPLSVTATANGNTAGSTLQGTISPDSIYTALGIAKINEAAPLAQPIMQMLNHNKTPDKDIVVAPNPAQYEIQVSGLKKGHVIRLFDLQGRLLQYRVAGSNTLFLPLESLSGGCYIVRVEDQTGNVITTKNIMKQ